jgi:hypothetical protein
LRFQRARPALPSEIGSCSALPTAPTVALQADGTSRVSPEGSRSVAIVPSFAISWTLVPADRAIFAPAPGRARSRGSRCRPGCSEAAARCPADLGFRAGHRAVALHHAVGRQDVALLAVQVVQQRDPRRYPIRVVLDVGHLRRHAVLVPAEIHDAR